MDKETLARVKEAKAELRAPVVGIVFLDEDDAGEFTGIYGRTKGGGHLSPPDRQPRTPHHRSVLAAWRDANKGSFEDLHKESP